LRSIWLKVGIALRKCFLAETPEGGNRGLRFLNASNIGPHLFRDSSLNPSRNAQGRYVV